MQTLARVALLVSFILPATAGSAMADHIVQDCPDATNSVYFPGGVPVNARIAFSPELGAWYVVWTQIKVSAFGPPREVVYGRIVTQGSPFALQPVEVLYSTPVISSGLSPLPTSPAVAATSSGFAIVYGRTDSNRHASTAMRWRTLAALLPEAEVPTSPADHVVLPNVAFNPSNGRLLVVWIGQWPDATVHVGGTAYQVAGSGSPTPSFSPQLIGASSRLVTPAVSRDFDGFHVAWLNPGAGNGVRITTTDADGVSHATTGELLASGGPLVNSITTAHNPAGSMSIAAWEQGGVVKGRCFMAILGQTYFDSTLRVFSGLDQWSYAPNLLIQSGTFHVAWTARNPNSTANGDIHANTIDARITAGPTVCDPIGGIESVASGANDEIRGSLGNGPVEPVAVWNAAYQCLTKGQSGYLKAISAGSATKFTNP